MEDLRTPAYVVDLEIAKGNSERMQDLASSLDVAVRPHVKTHKTETVALLQTRGLKRGITVSTLAEAEFFADRGWDDILYAVPLTPDKVKAAAKLTARLERFIVCVDNEAHADAILAHGRPAAASGGSAEDSSPSKPWHVALMVDCGYHREGIDPSDSTGLGHALAIVADLDGEGSKEPTSLFHGLYTHGGHSYDVGDGDVDAIRACAVQERDAVTYLAQELRKARQKRQHKEKKEGGDEGSGTRSEGDSCSSWPEMVAVGSTPTCSLPPLDGLKGVTEMHPGNYVFYDTAMLNLGACAKQTNGQRRGEGEVTESEIEHTTTLVPGSTDDIAVRVLTRVVGHYPNSNTLQVDMGWSAQGGGQGKHANFGTFTHRVWAPPRASIQGPDYEEPPEANAVLGLKVVCLKQECGEVTTVDGSPLDFSRFPVGCVLAFAPYHSCATGHNHPSLMVLEGGEVVAELEVTKGW